MKPTKTAVHFTAKELLQAPNPVRVILIGAGGTGSQVLTALAQMNHALNALNHPGLQVYLYDEDTVSEANQGRQLFARCEIGLPKAVALINRTNRFFGTSWKACTQMFDLSTGQRFPASIYISCTDTVDSRFEIADLLNYMDVPSYRQHQPRYWMDFGNGKTTGQVVLATIGNIEQPTSKKYRTVGNMPFVTEEFESLLKSSESRDDIPSCSLAEALNKQDLFINPALSKIGMSLLWNLFRRGMIQYRGCFLNLGDFRAQPIAVEG